MAKRTAIEFFSGIGAFSQAALRHDIEVIAAFDQSGPANQVYQSNYGLSPNARNLDTIKAKDIPEAADMWWMSPPCKPYTVRGNRLDDEDPRAKSLKNIIGLLKQFCPPLLMLENVANFESSRMHRRLIDQLVGLSYSVHHVKLCPTLFGVPMRRPRLFLIACLKGGPFEYQALKTEPAFMQPLASFLQEQPEAGLFLTQLTLERYMQGFDIVDIDNKEAVAICFTSGYARCMKVGGSMLRDTTGDIRRFSPCEMLKLFGFGDDFALPVEVSLPVAFRLIGNSVDVRSISHILDCILGSGRQIQAADRQTVGDLAFLGKKQGKREEIS